MVYIISLIFVATQLTYANPSQDFKKKINICNQQNNEVLIPAFVELEKA